MKKLFFTALALVFFSSISIAQENQDYKPSKLEVVINGKIGFAKLKQSGAPSLNGNLNGTDILVAYPISKNWDISGGVGIYEFNANTVVSGSSASLKNSYLRIPVLFNGDFSMYDNSKGEKKIVFTVGLGPYASTILKQELETVIGNADAKNLGWNFGISTQAGVKFIVSDFVNIGIGMEGQTDLTKAKKDGSEQKLENFNGMYLRIGFKF